MSRVKPRRWCPTPQQLMILRDLYARGMRNPKPDEVQQITARLSLYGKIDEKNVFYWFQNHQARERQNIRNSMLKQFQLYHLRQQQMFGRSAFTKPTTRIPIRHQNFEVRGRYVAKLEQEMMRNTWAPLEGGEAHIEWQMLKTINPQRPPQTLQLFPLSACSQLGREPEKSTNNIQTEGGCFGSDPPSKFRYI